jgi:hypothetical protein
VANEISPTVTPINTVGKATTVSTRKGYTNNALAIAPDGKTLYAGCFLATPDQFADEANDWRDQDMCRI